MTGRDIDGDTADGVPIEITLDDILRNLDFVWMNAFEARKGKWLALADVIYMDLGSDKDTPLGSKMNIGLEAWVTTPAGGYNVVDEDKLSLDVLAGVRYLWLGVDVTAMPSA